MGGIALCLSASSSATAGALEPGGRRSALLEIRLSTPLHSAKSRDGDSFDGVVVRDATKHVAGEPHVPAGTPVKGTVLYAKPGGALKSVGVLTLQLTEVGETPVESSRNHMSADALRPSGTADLVLPSGTTLKFNVKASSAGDRRRR